MRIAAASEATTELLLVRSTSKDSVTLQWLFHRACPWLGVQGLRDGIHIPCRSRSVSISECRRALLQTCHIIWHTGGLNGRLQLELAPSELVSDLKQRIPERTSMVERSLFSFQMIRRALCEFCVLLMCSCHFVFLPRLILYSSQCGWQPVQL